MDDMHMERKKKNPDSLDWKDSGRDKDVSKDQRAQM